MTNTAPEMDIDKLVEQLRAKKKPSHFSNPEPNVMQLEYKPDDLCQEAADALTAQKKRIIELEGALGYYAEAFCEHYGYELCGKLDDDICSGCKANAAFADTGKGE